MEDNIQNPQRHIHTDTFTQTHPSLLKTHLYCVRVYCVEMPHKSLYAPVSIPEVDIFTLLFEHKTSSSFSSFPDTKELLTDGQDPTRSYTRASLRAAATAFGRDVLEAQWGWRRGDVLAFYTPNDIDTAVLTCGCLWAGGVASPANPLYTVAELAFQLRNARARALVTQPAFLATASEAAARAGIPPERILLLGPVGVGAAAAAAASKPVMVGGGGGGGRGGGGGGGGLGHQQGTQGGPRHWRELLLPKPSSLLAAAWYGKAKVRPREDLAFLVYSSGTTGLPKGVRLTHYNVVANLLQNEQMDGQHLKPFGGPDNRGDRMLGVLPFFHIYVRILSYITHRYLCTSISPPPFFLLRHSYLTNTRMILA